MGSSGVEKEYLLVARSASQRTEIIGLWLSHQVMLGGYQIETSFTALVSDGFQVRVNECSCALILITYGACWAQQQSLAEMIQ